MLYDQDERRAAEPAAPAPPPAGPTLPAPDDPLLDLRLRQDQQRQEQQRRRQELQRRRQEQERLQEERQREIERLRQQDPSGGRAGLVRIVSRPSPAGAHRMGKNRASQDRTSQSRVDQDRKQAVTPRRVPSTSRATAVLAAGTFASRLTGFVRVLAVAYVLGVNSLSDAFNYANGIPNIIYDLLVGGILSATLIPVFVTHLGEEDHRERSRTLSAILTAVAVALVGVSILLWLAAPWVIRFYLVLSPSSTGAAERELATRLLRYFAPQVFFLGTTVASTALLNAARRFTAAAISPVINNLVAIAALLVTKVVAWHILTAKATTPDGTLQAFSHDSRAVAVLGIGTTLGYVVQLLVQLPAMHRMGLRLRPVWDLRHPAVRQVAGLSSWLVGVVLTNQASLALVTILAGRTAGGLTAYQFGYQFFQLPYALIAVSVASAIMPDLSDRWAAGERVAFERQFVTGLRVTLAALVPVGLVYMAVAQPFIQLAIHHGRVSASGAHLVTETLVYFAAGLPGFSAFFLLMRAYQAMKDAKGMFGIYVLENALTVVAAPILSFTLGVPGLALAWIGPYTIASIFAVTRLRRRVGALGGWFTIRALIRICVASAFTGAAALVVGLPFPSHAGDLILICRLVAQIGAGAVVYVLMARHLRIREIRIIGAAARRITG